MGGQAGAVIAASAAVLLLAFALVWLAWFSSHHS